MKRALELARGGYPAPNPRVGAVIAKGERVIGEGFHARRGDKHAEAAALEACVEDPRGGSLYVTLEPCCHEGEGKLRPPCCPALEKAGIERVVIGTLDPNPRVAGRGVARLRAAGMEVLVGVLEEQCRGLNPAYFHHRGTGRPYVRLKWAQSLDGFVAREAGGGRLTGSQAEAEAHRLRAESGAILVSAKTVSTDHPRLTTRRVPGPDALRLVLDTRLESPVGGPLFEPAGAGWILCGESCAEERRRPWLELGIPLLALKENTEGGIDLVALLDALGARGVSGLLVEGGPRLSRAFLEAKLVDELSVFLSPCLLGGGLPGPRPAAPIDPEAAARLSIVEARPLGQDILLRFRPMEGPEASCSPA